MFIAHHISNFGWYKNLLKGKYPPFRIFQIGIEDIIEISPAEKADNTEYLQELIPKLENLSHSQLVLVEKFITEIVIFIK